MNKFHHQYVFIFTKHCQFILTAGNKKSTEYYRHLKNTIDYFFVTIFVSFSKSSFQEV